MANVIRIIQKYKPDEIYNLAAQSSVALSFEQPLGTFYFNTASVNNLLESIRLFSPTTKLYQASSSEIYGKLILCRLHWKLQCIRLVHMVFQRCLLILW